MVKLRMSRKDLTVLSLIGNGVLLVGLLYLVIHFSIWSQIVQRVQRQHNNRPVSETYYDLRKSLFSIYQSNNTRIVMLGDSLTENGSWNELFSRTGISNQGIAGDTTEGMLNRLNEIYRLNPRFVVLMVGINDIAIKQVPVSEIITNYRILMDDLLQHKMNVVVQSTLYVSADFKESRQLNAKVKELNTFLSKYCQDRGIKYLDINRSLAPQGVLEQQYTQDGLHLNGAGYLIWRDQLLPTLTL